MSRNVALYLRVSTVRQADQDLSIPDQRRQAEVYCKRRGWRIVREFVERGASATTDTRPVFQDMIAEARRSERKFDAVLVHSYSRFAREAFDLEFYVRELKKRDVELVSITQETGNDPMGEMVRRIMALFDEYQSKENAKHTLRAMKENARQGFWNGSQPPFGYEAIEAEKRGDKVKKKLAILKCEAQMVRAIFDLYQHGTDGCTMGVKAIAGYLNHTGQRFRGNTRFSTGLVHRILTRETYAGRHHFNKTSGRARKAKPPSEWVKFKTPVIIPRATFAAVQERLRARQPKKQNPRLTNSPVLLSGIAVCSKCVGRMMLRTGKYGRYRYYTCAGQATRGKTACNGQSIPLQTLDDVVTQTLGETVFTPSRVKKLIAELQGHKSAGLKRAKTSAVRSKKELNKAETGIENLYAAIEGGTIELDNQLKGRINELKTQREKLIRDIARASQPLGIPKKLISNDNLMAFCDGFKKQLANGSPEFKKAYLRLFVDRVEVDIPKKEIRMTGQKSAVIGALTAKRLDDAGEVLTSVQEWRGSRGHVDGGYATFRNVSIDLHRKSGELPSHLSRHTFALHRTDAAQI